MEWHLIKNSSWNVIIFSVDNSSSPRTNNCKNNFLVLDEGFVLVLMQALVH